jgi:hypothetical protein
MMAIVGNTCNTLKIISSKEFKVDQYKPMYAAKAKQSISATYGIKPILR